MKILTISMFGGDLRRLRGKCKRLGRMVGVTSSKTRLQEKERVSNTEFHGFIY